MRQWRDELATELEVGRLSHTTLKRRLAALSSLYDFLNHQGHVICNPVRRVKRPRAPKPPASQTQKAAGDKESRTPCSLSYCSLSGSRGAVSDLVNRLVSGTSGPQLRLFSAE